MRNLVRNPMSSTPWITLVILLAMSAALPNRSTLGAAAAQRKAEIARAMNDVSLLIGRWVGEDMSVPPEAQKLLRPNAILSRTYRATGSPGYPALGVLIVHCGDARDMIGHYPPVCYPSAGWMQSPVDDADAVTLDAGGRPIPVRTYCFRHPRDHASEDVIRVFNAFILPDGTVTRDIDDINRQSERLAVSIQGVAQLQVITTQEVSMVRAVKAADELLAGMTPLFDALGVDKGGSHGEE